MRYLTNEEFQALPDGEQVVVMWIGSDDPHQYTVQVDKRGIRRVKDIPLGLYFYELGRPLVRDNKTLHATFVVWLVEEQ